MRGRLARAAAFSMLILVPGRPAHASGGEHVVDDAAVEKAGTCHLESWITVSGRRSGLANLSPACTRKMWQNLEIGGFLTRSWTGADRNTVIGFAPKLALLSEDRGVGVGIATSLGYGTRPGRFETASVIVPVTMAISSRVRVNLDAGWQWSRPTGHDLFVGGQAEIAVTNRLGLMVEAFTRDRGKAGRQAGLRWTPGRGSFDIDLVGGRYVDGARRNAITIGITVRR